MGISRKSEKYRSISQPVFYRGKRKTILPISGRPIT